MVEPKVVADEIDLDYRMSAPRNAAEARESESDGRPSFGAIRGRR
jgi:hypothetical protein